MGNFLIQLPLVEENQRREWEGINLFCMDYNEQTRQRFVVYISPSPSSSN